VGPQIADGLDIAEQIAALRDTATDAGLDWSQIKALLKAQIQDERDENGDGKRVKRLLEKADHATAYADLLGLSNMNEEKYFAEVVTAPPHDPITGEIQETETRPVPAAPQPELDGAAEGEGAVNLTPSAAPIPIPPVDPPSSQGMADEAAEGADSQLGPSAADTSDDLALPACLDRAIGRAA
jgi:hypothetical protein